MFGKRPTQGGSQAPRQAPPPAAEGPAIATRPQRIEPAAAPSAPVQTPPPAERAAKPAAGPKPTLGFEQLRAAQGPAPTTQVVREQSDYYHAT